MKCPRCDIELNADGYCWGCDNYPEPKEAE